MSNKINNIWKSGYLLFFAIINIAACTKFVQINPPATEITGTTVYSNNSSAAAAMTGIYSNMMANQGISSGTSSISYLQGLGADELNNFSTDPTLSQFYQNALKSTSQGPTNSYYWGELYNELHVTNAVIEGLAASTGVTPVIKQQLVGEAKFMRAFMHFYAVNLYGDVPLVTSTNYLTNNSISRTPVVQVYQQIIQDLKDAQTNLSDSYLNAYGVSTKSKTRPNKGAAEALLARAYLYVDSFANAEAEATLVINNTSNYMLDTLNGVFLANSSEAIWQLAPVSPEYNTFDAYNFVLTSPPQDGTNTEVSLSTNLVNSFETGDLRLSDWVGVYTADSITFYYYPYKYKVYAQDQPVIEYVMVLRLAEQYLIRAEAEAQLNDLTNSANDLNIVRARAGLPNTTASSQADLLIAIQHERQVEFFTEWGHRWFDLIRTKNIDSVMGSPGNVCAQKGGAWNPDWSLFPLPLTDLQIDPNLTQNPGY